MHRARLISILLVSTLFFGAVAARAEAPPGPRLATVSFHHYPNAGTELASFAPDGTDPSRIVGGPDTKGPAPVVDARPSWSADGSRLAFLGVRGAAAGAIFTVNSDGSDPAVVPLSRKLLTQGDPVLAPDGRSVAVMRIDVISGHFDRPLPRRRGSDDEYGVKVRTAIWSLSIDGSKMRTLTAWSRRAFLQPSSFLPDGSRLAATEWRGGATQRAISIDLSTHHVRVLAPNAAEPVYASDGSVAAVRDRLGRKGRLEERQVASSTLLVVPAEGGRARPDRAGSWRSALAKLGSFGGAHRLHAAEGWLAAKNAPKLDCRGQRQRHLPDHAGEDDPRFLRRLRLAARSGSRSRADRLLAGKCFMRPCGEGAMCRHVVSAVGLDLDQAGAGG